MLIYYSSLDNQHSLVWKFSKQWFGPYVIKQAYDIATYLLRELDGTELKIPIARQRIKLFRRHGEDSLEDSEDDIECTKTEDDEDQDEDQRIVD
jgi:hypothetical protein